MLETLKERFDRDRDFQAYIEKLSDLLTSMQKITTKMPLFETGGSRKPAPSQPSQIPQKLRFVGVITSKFVRNPDKTSQVVAS